MTITNGYTTLSEYKAWIATRGLAGSVGTDASDDTSIELIIEGASRYIDGQTGGIKFAPDTQDATRYYTAEDAGFVYIDNLSAAPTSVSVDMSNTRSYTALASTDYDLMPFNALADGRPFQWLEIAPNVSVSFPTTAKGVRVIGKFGYPSIPDDIVNACLMISQNVYSLRTGQSSSGKITVTAAGVVIRPEEVPAIAQKTLKRYEPLV